MDLILSLIAIALCVLVVLWLISLLVPLLYYMGRMLAALFRLGVRDESRSAPSGGAERD
ncbi:hypothetical protein N8I74_06765 [Chitiniphilus purpureus]|uniref:Uncharacterized protein n=1 Tax=Chitiniphilus purpureus TaxID=2981137 RepID=A0ABY6DSM0_9NEIS|nr:hypothetical protein [Chitiniphilus sp. CD1]UXY16718.1 hypothetical protein N8I74_06765 [Chitiniphilus sp. CD1]